MTTLTDKELIKEIKERIGSLDVRDNIERRAYEIALASLEEEPVAWLHSDNGLGIPAITRSKNIADSWLSKGWYVQPLYIAKPVPVVPDARPTLNNGIVGFDEGWNACRATMLHGVKPVSQTYKLNKLSGNYPVTPDGLSTVCAEAYQVVGVMADALGVFGDAAVQKVLDNLSQQKLVHRDVLPFSLPVTPDGWVMVPKQVTPEISNAINVVGQRCTCGNCSQRLWDLLLDATQQGVNRG